jgi:hypothetical protein
MKFKNILAFMASAAIAFTACHKPVDNVPGPPPPIGVRIMKIIYTHENVSYLYNTDGTLKEAIIRSNNGPSTGRYEYFYENGKLKEARSGNIRLTYSYPDASTIQVALKGITGITSYSSEYKFSGSRLLEWIQYKYGSGGKQPDHKAVHTYNNAGNIVKSEHYEHTGAAWMRYETVDIQYDDKPNYTSHADNMPYHLGQIRILTNNPVKETYRDINGTVYKTVSYQHSFDALGRKTKSVVKTVEDGVPEMTNTILFEY